MSIFYENLVRFEDGADKLEEKKAIQRDIARVTKDIMEQYGNVDAKDVGKMKNFLYYYGVDWTEAGPLSPDDTAEEKCKLSKVFRQLQDAINVIREFGKLDMLKPIIDALEDDGIHLSIDKYDNFVHADDYLKSIVSLYGQAKKATEEYKDNIKAEAVANLIATSKGYDVIANSIMKSRSGKKSKIDKCSETITDLVEDNMLDNSVYRDCIEYLNEQNRITEE